MEFGKWAFAAGTAQRSTVGVPGNRQLSGAQQCLPRAPALLLSPSRSSSARREAGCGGASRRSSSLSVKQFLVSSPRGLFLSATGLLMTCLRAVSASKRRAVSDRFQKFVTSHVTPQERREKYGAVCSLNGFAPLSPVSWYCVSSPTLGGILHLWRGAKNLECYKWCAPRHERMPLLRWAPQRIYHTLAQMSVLARGGHSALCSHLVQVGA